MSKQISALLVLASVLASCSPSKIGPPSSASRTSLERANSARDKRLVDRNVSERSLRDDETPAEEKAAYQPLHATGPDFDAIHYRVSLDFPASSLTAPEFTGEVELTFQPVQNDYQVLNLDSEGLEIESIRLLNTFEDLRYEQRADQLQVDLGRPYQPGEVLTVAIRYRWAGNDDRGLYFRSRSGVKEIEAFYSQSEPELSKHWFPGNSRPNDKATFEAILKVPAPFVAVSNGALVSQSEAGGFKTTHWSQRIPMVSYLFVVTAGKYGVQRESWKGVPVEFYGYTDDMERTKYSLRNTSDMLRYFSDRVGLLYPYEKYAQTVVPQYMWGGMEHTTATTLTDRTLHGPAEDAGFSSDGLVAHELAHQWFGDLVTCRGWDHLWLNEGFATYFEILYAEHKHGRARYLAELADGAEWYFWEESQDSKPVVFPYYRSTLDEYFSGYNYAKGSWVLHMLRELLGDEVFFKGIRQYIHRHQGKLVVTEDLRQALEAASGKDLTWFFDQWLYKPGFPDFAVSWSSADGKVALTVAQVQDRELPGGVAGLTPLFRGPIAVEVDGVRRTVALSGLETETFELPTARTPRYVKFNAENQWLARVKTTQSAEAWSAQLKASLDPVARIEAAQALQGAVAVPALLNCGKSDGEAWVRSSCVTALATLLKDEALLESQATAAYAGAKDLLSAKAWEVRAAVPAVAARLGEGQALPLLRTLINGDAETRVVVAAIEAVGLLKGAGVYELLAAQLGRTSFQNRAREAALAAIGQLGDLRSLELGEEYSTARYDERTRFGAFSLLAQVGKKFEAEARERARLALEASLNDVNMGTRLKAIDSLIDLGDSAAIPALRKVESGDTDGRVRNRARDAIAKLSK